MFEKNAKCICSVYSVGEKYGQSKAEQVAGGNKNMPKQAEVQRLLAKRVDLQEQRQGKVVSPD
jgi:hypothetical protein